MKSKVGDLLLHDRLGRGHLGSHGRGGGSGHGNGEERGSLVIHNGGSSHNIGSSGDGDSRGDQRILQVTTHLLGSLLIRLLRLVAGLQPKGSLLTVLDISGRHGADEGGSQENRENEAHCWTSERNEGGSVPDLIFLSVKGRS